MNNAFFGKTMENVRERVNLEIIPHTKIDHIIKRQSKLSFKGISISQNDFSLYRLLNKRQSLINQFICDSVF